ncbi:MAG: J domain-containing protein [Candidatus Binatia bacterium]
MSQPDFYAIFGVSPSASQKEIRAAHRELVKRYHPDIYSTSGDKARATEKLQAINQAYAVLGNAERRKRYDASRVESQRSARPVAQERPAHVRRASSPPRRKAAPRPVRVRRKVHRKFQWMKRFLTFPWLAGAVAGVVLSGVMVYLFAREPGTLPAWILLQKTDVEQGASAPVEDARAWEQLASFRLKAECAQGLKSRVKRDQEQGSHTIFDETNGTVAITVLLNDPAVSSKEPAGQKSITRWVRHYECRAVQIRQPDPWLRRKLRAAGLLRSVDRLLD